MSKEAAKHLEQVTTESEMFELEGFRIPEIMESYHQEKMKAKLFMSMPPAMHSPLNEVTGPPPKESGTGARSEDCNWISVDCRMPETSEYVLFVNEAESQNIGECLDGEWVEREEYKQIEYVTHWQSLPKPPKSGTGKLPSYELVVDDDSEVSISLSADPEHGVPFVARTIETSKLYQGIIDAADEAMESALNEIGTRDWISVHVRMPPDEVSVLTHTKGQVDVDIQNIQEIQNAQCWCGNLGYELVSESEVTHWMPIPKPPTQ